MTPRTPSVTVIMPAYNIEGYIARAIESVRAQTLEDWELIVVDDGSTDRTGHIADRIAERDWRIDVIHTENAGAPAARNLALDRARGTYIHFMDGDDWAERTMLEDEVTLARENDLELVIAGFYIDTYYGEDSDHLVEEKVHPPVIFEDQHMFRKHAYALFDLNLLYSPWNKLFVRERIERLGLRFRDTFWDDFPFVLDYIRDVERVGVIDHCYYHFIRAREDSETSRFRPQMYEKREEEHGWMLDLYRHWGLDQDPDSMEMVHRRYIERLVGCIENVCNPASSLKEDETRRIVGEMINSERARESLEVAQPRSRMMQIMLWPIRRRDVNLTIAEGRIISFVKRSNPRTFAQLKASR